VSEQYWVRLCKEDLVFSAAHFITFCGNTCERLHGHNYRVAVYVFGPLDENHYVVDFIALRDALKAVLEEVDHRMLLPTEHRSIRVTGQGEEVEVRFEDRRWVFPREDCVLLPLSNTTAELLARHIGKQLQDRLQAQTGTRPQRLRVEVDENGGQWGVCELAEP
jgi:6-pyruvoyltetrahydropterin/6-carboxytetrahydropterin synthase